MGGGWALRESRAPALGKAAARSFARGVVGRAEGAMTMQKDARGTKTSQNRMLLPPPPAADPMTAALIFSKIDASVAWEIADTFKNIAANQTLHKDIKQVIAELLLKLPAKTYGTNLYHLDVKTLYNGVSDLTQINKILTILKKICLPTSAVVILSQVPPKFTR